LIPRILVLFLDGLGLGIDDPDINPLVAAEMPNLLSLLDGRPLILDTCPFEGDQASLFALDAGLGIQGIPQSATGQAVLLTGRNIPAEIGEHYGPKPNPAITDILRENNLFMEVLRRGGTAALLNAYPPRYFQAIIDRRRLYSTIPLAVNAAGIDLMTAQDLQAGRALSPDFTGVGWTSQPDFPPAPVYSPKEAGVRLARLSQAYTMTWFDYWLSDYAGHRGTLHDASSLLETFDTVLGGLLEAWDRMHDLIILTSDHGNLEDLSARGHTINPVPALLIGPGSLRSKFAEVVGDLTSFFPAVLRVLYD
jgi:2,3-bisphosphoglycerate-independent phosphoglycerate mutase